MIQYTFVIIAIAWIECHGQRDPCNSFKPVLSFRYWDQIDLYSRIERLLNRGRNAAWNAKRRTQPRSGVD